MLKNVQGCHSDHARPSAASGCAETRPRRTDCKFALSVVPLGRFICFVRLSQGSCLRTALSPIRFEPAKQATGKALLEFAGCKFLVRRGGSGMTKKWVFQQPARPIFLSSLSALSVLVLSAALG